jgi:hypothetical protein
MEAVFESIQGGQQLAIRSIDGLLIKMIVGDFVSSSTVLIVHYFVYTTTMAFNICT